MRGVSASGLTFYRPKGCPECDHSGYYGRLGLFELMSMDSTIRDMTFRQESTTALRQYAQSAGGMTTLVEDGARKVVEGITSVDEILRVTSTME